MEERPKERQESSEDFAVVCCRLPRMITEVPRSTENDKFSTRSVPSGVCNVTSSNLMRSPSMNFGGLSRSLPGPSADSSLMSERGRKRGHEAKHPCERGQNTQRATTMNNPKRGKKNWEHSLYPSTQCVTGVKRLKARRVTKCT